MANEVKRMNTFHDDDKRAKHRAIYATCRRCGTEIRAGLSLCKKCLPLVRRNASLKGWRTRKRMALARASR
jgi:hypothetical protein